MVERMFRNVMVLTNDTAKTFGREASKCSCEHNFEITTVDKQEHGRNGKRPE